MPNKSTQIQSRKFLAATKVPAKQSHSAVLHLKNIVEEGRRNLANSLEEKALRVYARYISADWVTALTVGFSMNRDYQLKDALIKVMVDAQQDQTEVGGKGFKQSSASEPTASTFYQSAKSRIASSRELLGHYERASKQVAFGKEVPMMVFEWEKDSQTLQNILSRQEAKIKLELHCFLHADPKSSKEQLRGDMLELDTDLWKRFGVGETRKGIVELLDEGKDVTWAMVAKNVQRGVRRTIRTLPEDGE